MTLLIIRIKYLFDPIDYLLLLKNHNHMQPQPNQPPLDKKVSANSTKPPQQKKQKQPAIRKIPETLVQSYDLVTLKQERKKRFKPQKAEQQEADYMKLMAQKLRPIYGPCVCWYEGDNEQTETVYQLSAASLVLSKLDIIKVKNIRKIKLKTLQNLPKESNKVIKINWLQDLNPQLVMFIHPKKAEEAYFLYAAIITRKMMADDFVIHDIETVYRDDFSGGITSIEGEILKLSNYLKNWERRKIVIGDNLQLQSFKDTKCTFTIKSIKEVWTRFGMHNGYLIIKLHHGIQKNQLGIPLIDYTNITSTKNWLFMLSKMLN